MKLNRKGFMMAEVVVVSAVVVVALTSLYASYNKIYSIYKTRLTYTDSSTLYRLAYYRDKLNKNGELFNGLAVADVKDVDLGTNKLCKTECTEKLYIIKNGYKNINDTINNKVKNLAGINSKCVDYVKYLSSSVDLKETEYVMIYEMCDAKNKDDCEYAYLGEEGSRTFN